MLNVIQVRNSAGALLNLPLEDPADGFQVFDVAGLDPVKATIVSSSFAQMDGSQYHSARRESRNILLTLGLDITEAPAALLRSRLYAFMMPKTAITLRFTNIDGSYFEIDGRVESYESPLFAKDLTVTVSVICFDPDFIDPVATELVGTTVSDSTAMTIDYKGSVETGIVLTMPVNRDMSGFSIYSRIPDNTVRQFDFAANLHNTDVVTISTVPGNKYARLTRDSSTSSVLYGVSPYSKWIDLEPGVNTLRVFAEGAAVPFTIQYHKRLGGL